MHLCCTNVGSIIYLLKKMYTIFYHTEVSFYFLYVITAEIHLSEDLHSTN